MRRCSAFLRRSMARCCWSRYPAYLISISTDLSSLRISDERWAWETLTAEDAECAEELLSKKPGRRSRRTGASCSIVISGRFSSCASDWPMAADRSCEVDLLSAKAAELCSGGTDECVRPHAGNAAAVSFVLSSTCFTSSSRCCLV